MQAISADDLQGSVTRQVRSLPIPSYQSSPRSIVSEINRLRDQSSPRSIVSEINRLRDQSSPRSIVSEINLVSQRSVLISICDFHRVRFARLTWIRKHLGGKPEELEPPYDASTFVEDDEYLILDLVLNWVSKSSISQGRVTTVRIANE